MFREQDKYVSQKPDPQNTGEQRNPGASQSDKGALLHHTDAETDYRIGIDMQGLVGYIQHFLMPGEQNRQVGGQWHDNRYQDYGGNRADDTAANPVE